MDRNRPFVQRCRVSPELTANESGSSGTATHSPDGIRTSRPGTSDWGSQVMKFTSVWGAIPNWFSPAATGG